MSRKYLLLVVVLLASSSCASHIRTIPKESRLTAYTAQNNRSSNFVKYAPVFVAYQYDHPFNRIGRPVAVRDGFGGHEIRVDSTQPVYYTQVQRFSTASGDYVNLIYRVHFPEIPFSLIPFHLTAGYNAGLMVVITLDSKEQPVLVTTVHTCGCYLAIVPTTFLPAKALPQGWKEGRLDVYGERLPSMLDYANMDDPRLLVHLRPGDHRVMDLEIVERSMIESPERAHLIPSVLESTGELERIPMNGKTTSLYHKKGPLKGHVKGSFKILEALSLSLISWDFFVGSDKVYGDRNETGNPFYTSLKPWNRIASDMYDFPAFLEFWGWRL